VKISQAEMLPCGCTHVYQHGVGRLLVSIDLPTLPVLHATVDMIDLHQERKKSVATLPSHIG
jgi:hypothetical protein